MLADVPPLPSENPVALVPVDEPIPRTLQLSLRLEDPEVVAELWRLPAGAPREGFASAALRVGVLSLRMAGGQLDTEQVKRAGQEILAEVRELLSTRATTLTEQLARSLAAYFDPGTGLVTQRLEALARDGGELDRRVRELVGPEDSLLVRSLSRHVGDRSPLFQLLSPEAAGGLKAQIEGTVRSALELQREQLLRQFSLDVKDSALSRLVGELRARQVELGTGLREQVDGLVQEFSVDAEGSALNRLSRLLQQTAQQVDRNLTLDDEQSPLARLKRSLDDSIATLGRNSAEFQQEVRETLASMKVRREEAARSAAHGRDFEQQLGTLLLQEAQRTGDVHQACGGRPGKTRSKVGDHVVTLGADMSAAGARIVFEAKDRAGVTLQAALDELEEARSNREAGVGVFVFSRATCPEGLAELQRYGDAFVVSWDPGDTRSDLYVRAAYLCARALCVRQRARTDDVAGALEDIEAAILRVQKQVESFEDIRKWATTVSDHGRRIVEKSEKMVAGLDESLEALQRATDALQVQEA